MIKQSIPKTRLRRELRKWMNYFDKHPFAEVTVTVNKMPKSKLISPDLYELLKNNKAELTAEDKAWLNSTPVGKEEI